MSDYELQLRHISQVLAEIAYTLESSDNRIARVERVLALARNIVPSRECALLEVDGPRSILYVVPPTLPPDQAPLIEALMELYRLVAGGQEIERPRGGVPSLTLPIVGLDEVIGVIRVQPAQVPYDAGHLRLLSVVAAQLGAYLAMTRLRERDEAHTKELAAAHDFQRLLAGMVGHDLRNPLAVIHTVAAVLLEGATDGKQAKALERALRNAEHATRLITDLVDVTESRVNGSIRVLLEEADFCKLVTNVVEDLRQANANRRLEYTSTIDVLPGQCDPLRFAQVVTNLVNNALIHGDASVPVEVNLTHAAELVTLSVHNAGPPIPPELLATIFDPFKSSRSSRRRPHSVRGLGLGLYIVDQLVRGHGGDVQVTSSIEHGTVFTVRIPRYSTTMEYRGPASIPEHSLVMIVDDDADVRELISGLLQKRGYGTVTAGNGLEALAQLRAGPRPQLILLDLQMPVMDGEAFCEECSHDTALADIPIVIISSDTASAVKLSGTRARGYLTKPVPIDQLLATVRGAH